MSQSRNADTRAERPLTARSLVASTLLGTHPPVLPGRVLVRLGELFGIAEGTTRVALSRMVAAGELEAEDGRYRLVAPALLARQATQERGRVVPPRKWNGQWVMAVILADRREAPDRAALRSSAVTLGLAELRQGVWLRPDNLDWDRQIGTATGDAYGVVDAQCAWMAATPAGDGAELARQLWDLDSWATEATRLTSEMKRTRRSLDGGGFDAIPGAFVTSAAVLRLFRGDPLLPVTLLPARWPGDALRETYRGYDLALRTLLRAFFMPTPDPPSRAGRTRTQPVSARASIGRCVRRAYRITWSARMCASTGSGAVRTTGAVPASRSRSRSTRAKAGWKCTVAAMDTWCRGGGTFDPGLQSWDVPADG